MPEDIYARVAQRAPGGGGSASCWTPPGPALRAALGSGIELIKPSLGELEALAGRTLPDPREQEAEALALVRAGAARLVAVTLGEEGAFVASRDGRDPAGGAACEVSSAVGAGDSFTAAMTLALANGATAGGRAGLGRRRRHRRGRLRRDRAHPAGGRGDAIPAADGGGRGSLLRIVVPVMWLCRSRSGIMQGICPGASVQDRAAGILFIRNDDLCAPAR